MTKGMASSDSRTSGVKLLSRIHEIDIVRSWERITAQKSVPGIPRRIRVGLNT